MMPPKAFCAVTVLTIAHFSADRQVWSLSAEKHILLANIHHSITDGVSVTILQRELAAAYTAALQAADPAWEPLPVQVLPVADRPTSKALIFLVAMAWPAEAMQNRSSKYCRNEIRRCITMQYGWKINTETVVPPFLPQVVDYAAWQREHLAGAVMDVHIDFWRQTLADAPPLLELPTDRPRPDVMSLAGAEHRLTLPEAARSGLQRLAAAQQTTPFVVALTAVQVSSATVNSILPPLYILCMQHNIELSWLRLS